ncbi:MAG: M23 family metallopeptidase [bacterium]|nr:M23 family metallopeptidase [bacterium]MCP4799790.1 M23 family metallopeptidase [bacterium]
MYFTLWIIILCMLPAQLLATEKFWPLDLSTRYLTSNFMEYREGRFHAGLDLKTDSHTGIPVIAVESGWISRLKTTSNGYGKVLYLTTESGETYVYAHLERIADRFQPAIISARSKANSYTVSLRFARDRFPVKAGEILALSGQSGTNGPHLHFEIRNNSQHPMNPQLQGFTLNDNIAPLITSVTAIPTTAESTINGESWARSISGTSLNGDLGDLYISGGVAFTAKIIEKSDIKGHLLEPYRIEMKLDGKTVYLAENREFSFNDMPYMKLEWLNQPGKRERWLFKRSQNKLGGREGNFWSENIVPGEHLLELVTTDATGNSTVVNWTVHAGRSEVDETSKWKIDSVRVDLPNNLGQVSPFLTFNSKGQVARAPRDMLVFPDSLCDKYSPGLTLVGNPLLLVSADSKELKPQLVSTSWEYTEGAAVYRLNKNKWGFVSEPTVSSSGTTFFAAMPGKYALFTDNAAPKLDTDSTDIYIKPRLASTVKGITFPKWEEIIILVSDSESGIDLESIKVKLDGANLIVEPDMPRKRLLITIPDAASVGNHTLDVVVSDNSGNSTAKAWKIITNSLVEVD